MGKNIEDCTIDELLSEIRRRFETNQSVENVVKENVEKEQVKIMLTIKEASIETGLSYNAIRQMCLKNKIKHVRAGTKFLINKDALMEYLYEGEKNG